ncbi:MAG: amidohydrolase family protein [Actinobacteria bacterium]|nr:amidohydrolase family protein [Actinomycetota bacterium]MBI3686865.1 amidohydrolase family protein [Actinomycetota bacterium]
MPPDVSGPLVLHRAPVVLPVGAEPIRDGAVLVASDRIAWVGRHAAYAGPPVPSRDWPGVLMPGLVNAHTHLQYTGYADMYRPGVDFFGWITQIAPRSRAMTAAAWTASTRAGVAEALRTGTTCVADIATVPEAVTVVAEAGLAGVSYVEVVGVDAASWPRRRDTLLSILAVADPDGPAGGRAVGVSPHALYTISSGAFRELVALARERGLRLHPHAAESRYESEYVATGDGRFAAASHGWGLEMELVASGGSGRTPVGELAALGCLGADVHLAHGVEVSADDLATLRDHGAVVALCARSNATLGCGEPPVAAYRSGGNLVAVGTDSRASSPSLDLLAELPVLRDIALRQGSPPAGLDRWLVEAATVGGARAMGLAGVGVLAPGARADLAAFDVPVTGDPYAALVEHGAGRCVGTVLAGEEV